MAWEEASTYVIWILFEIVAECLEVISLGKRVGPWQSGEVILRYEDERRKEKDLLLGSDGRKPIDLELNHTTPLSIELQRV